MRTRIHEINSLGQSIWCDSISRSMIRTGELARMIDDGVVGVTSNPTIFQQAIAGSADYDEAIDALLAEGKSADAIYEALTTTDIADAADVLRPVYDRTAGLDGYISIEVNPHLAHDTAGTLTEARHLWRRLNRPNVFIKVPATAEGIPAIETLIGEGLNVNVTLIFSLTLYGRVMEAYVRGLERLQRAGGGLGKVASVASFFVSRVDTLVDKKVQDRINAGNSGLKGLLGKAAVANAKRAYQQFLQVFHGPRFASLGAAGARRQRPLWASTGTKNPAYSDVCYVDPLIGPETVNTLPVKTIEAVKDHATPAVTIENDVPLYDRALADLEAAGVNMEAVTAELLSAGVKAFSDSFDALMRDIRNKIARLQTA